METLSSGHVRWVRVLGGLPGPTWVYMYGVEQMQQSIGLYWVILQGSLYILGAALYAVRCQSRRSCMACTGWSADSLKV